jgi:hypothetical protein
MCPLLDTVAPISGIFYHLTDDGGTNLSHTPAIVHDGSSVTSKTEGSQLSAASGRQVGIVTGDTEIFPGEA